MRKHAGSQADTENLSANESTASGQYKKIYDYSLLEFDTTQRRNVGNYLPYYMMSHSRRQYRLNTDAIGASNLTKI